MELARRHLGPPRRGLEIGASAVNPFDGLRCWNLEHPDAAVWAAAQQALTASRAPIHVHGTADELPLRDGALDYLLSSHVIEHLPNTIGALREWDRVVRPGGTLFLIAPHQQRTFDAARARTSLQHHLADHALGMTEATDALAPTSHYHVWRTEDFVALVEHLVRVGWLDWRVLEVEDVDSKAGNGFTLVVEKRARTPRPSAPAGPVAFWFATLELPFQLPGQAVEHLPGAGLEHVVPDERWPDDPPLPRGSWRVVPIHAGFPPVAGRARRVLVGEPLPAPRLDALRVRGSTLHVEGDALVPGTWLEAQLPDGSVFRALPRCVDGALQLDLTGLVIPPGAIPLRAVNAAPGGGASEPLPLTGRPG